MQENWRETIARTSVPHEGCFQADFPNAVWVEASCSVAPDKVYVPHGRGGPQTVGNGVDYAASVTNLMSAAVGTFPTVTGVTSERDGSANVYSIQLNSNFMSTAACNGHSGCLAWEQFVYSSSETVGVHAVLADRLRQQLPERLERVQRQLLQEQRRGDGAQAGDHRRCRSSSCRARR